MTTPNKLTWIEYKLTAWLTVMGGAAAETAILDQYHAAWYWSFLSAAMIGFAASAAARNVVRAIVLRAGRDDI